MKNCLYFFFNLQKFLFFKKNKSLFLQHSPYSPDCGLSPLSQSNPMLTNISTLHPLHVRSELSDNSVSNFFFPLILHPIWSHGIWAYVVMFNICGCESVLNFSLDLYLKKKDYKIFFLKHNQYTWKMKKKTTHTWYGGRWETEDIFFFMVAQFS